MYLPKEVHDFTDEQLQQAAQRVADVYSRLLNKRFKCALPVPAKLTFDLQLDAPKCAGRASSKLKVELNMPMLREYPTEVLNQTLPHELAHLVEFAVFDAQGVSTQRGCSTHGPEFCLIMKTMGLEPERNHNMDPTSAKLERREHLKRIRQQEREDDVEEGE